MEHPTSLEERQMESILSMIRQDDDGRIVVSCENGEAWTALATSSFFATIDGKKCRLDVWNSILKEAYYTVV